MRVVVLGPNLEPKNQAKGSLHAHAQGCFDIVHRYTSYEQRTGDTIEVETIKDLVTSMYDPGDFGYDEDDPDQYNPFRSDIYVAPCVTIPEGSPHG